MSSRFVVQLVSWEEGWSVDLQKYTVSVPKLLVLGDNGTRKPRLKHTRQVYAVLNRQTEKIKTFFPYNY